MIDIIWVILCSFLVFFMQPGFLCLEAGLTRTKNAINVAIKNISDFGVSSLIFWAVGFGFMFGETKYGWIGGTDFFPGFESDPARGFSFFLFQIMFCGTAVTIISGAVAERISFLAYLLIAVVVSALIYPIFGHWAWGGSFTGNPSWLLRLGFVDFAGASVVHGIGGWASLAIILIIGPRTGRFQKETEADYSFSGSHLPLAMTGVFFLWIGWIGFNGGSTFAFSDQVPKIIVNTVLAGSAGMLTAGTAGGIQYGYPKIITIMNGSLAGLVSITACCFAVSPGSAIIIGGIGGLVMIFSSWALVRLKIDDVIGAVPVHLMSGIWGTIAVALFSDRSILATGLGRLEQLQIQLYGISVCFLMGFCATYIIFRILNYFWPLRISHQAEIEGLNFAENREISDIYNLSKIMQEQEQTHDLSLRVPTIDPNTEIGQIARQYNQLMDTLQSSMTHVSHLEQSKAEILSYQMRLNAILDNAADGLITFNEQGIIESYNKSCEQMFGYRAEEVLGKKITMLMPEAYAENYDLYFKNYQETGDRKIIGADQLLEGRRKDGKIFPADLSVAVIKLGSETIFSGIIRDITRQKNAEDEMRRSNKALELFASVASHDLKAPLGYIAMCTSLIKQGHEDKLDEEGREFLDIMTKSAIKMQQMIQNLLEYSRIGDHKARFEDLDINEVISEALEKLTLPLQESGANIHYHDLPHITGNKSLLVQLFQNLIGNAVKYRKAGITPEISVEATKEDQNWVFSISDNGIGIDSKFKDKIFVVFQRLHTDDDYEGSGVGLTFCQRIVEFHGGKIWLDTDYKDGSRFCFTLSAQK